MLRIFRGPSIALGAAAPGAVAVPADSRDRDARWLRLAQRVRASPALQEICALGFLAGVVLLSFRQAIAYGLVAFEKDTLVFFYPLEAWFAQEFKAGHFPLWNPYIFAGYPALADGESGLAYPLHLLLLRLLSVDQTFIWLRVSSVLIAAASMYALCRALGLGRLPGVLAGVTFSLGSFFLSQQHHENVTRTAAWLPLAMACTEWALHRAGWRRHVFLTLAGVALAMAAVGLHPQVLGMALLGYSGFVAARVLIGPVGPRDDGASPGFSALPSPPRSRMRHLAAMLRHSAWALTQRVALMSWVGVYVVVLGLGLAAVQLVPLAELGAATYRGSAPDYFFATSYALPMQNLINLIFPYFFRGPDATYWSLWARWETALYVGVAPLLLGFVGAILARRREALFFVVLAVAGLWLAFGTYAPFDLYGLLWQLPGFSAFRVPGRYTYLFVLAWSVLAAFGLHALATPGTGSRRGERIAALSLLVILGLGLALLVYGAGSLRSSLLADPGGGLAWIEHSYVALRHTPEGLDPRDAYQGLVHSLDFANPRTRLSLFLASASLLLLGGLVISRRTTRLWQIALIGLATTDLLVMGMSFHQTMPVGALAEPGAATRFLMERASAAQPLEPGPGVANPASGSMAPGKWRAYTPGESVPSMEFNRLVPFHVEDLGGYSSAEPRENYVYWTTVHSLQNRLLDVANVRYLVLGSQSPALPSYRTVPFDPERPLMLGSRGSIGGAESFTLGGEVGHRIQVIAALTRALEIPQGDVVAELTVVPREGPPAVLELRAGVQVAEWAYDRPDTVGKARHERPAEIAFRRPDVFPLDGSRYDLYFYYSEQDLPREMQVERVDLRYVHERGGIELYGLGLYNFNTHQTVGVTQEMRSALQPVYRDAQTRIFENVAAFPRAYVVPRARIAPQGMSAFSAMVDTPFDPATEIMLEPEAALSLRDGNVSSPDGPGATPQPAAVEQIVGETDRVVFRVNSPQAGYFVDVAHDFPGWHAAVDGRDTPLYRANGLFRAVPIQMGEHTVELRYEPLPVALGLQMSVWAACGGLAVVAGALLAAWITRRRSVG